MADKITSGERMSGRKTPGLTVIVFVVFLAVLAVYAWLIIDMAGILPGDTGTEPVATPAETEDGGGSWLMDLAAMPWTFVVLLSTVALGLVIAFEQRRASKVTPEEEARTELATRRMHEEQADPQAKD